MEQIFRLLMTVNLVATYCYKIYRGPKVMWCKLHLSRLSSHFSSSPSSLASSSSRLLFSLLLSCSLFSSRSSHAFFFFFFRYAPALPSQHLYLPHRALFHSQL